MTHPAYLSIINDLSVCSHSQVELEEGVLSIQRGKEPDEWVFSMRVKHVEKEDQEILSCFFSSGLFQFSDRDVLLKWDPKSSSLYAIQHVFLTWKEFIPFRQTLSHFLSAVHEYRSYLSETPA